MVSSRSEDGEDEDREDAEDVGDMGDVEDVEDGPSAAMAEEASAMPEARQSASSAGGREDGKRSEIIRGKLRVYFE